MDKSGERSGIIITRGASNGALVADLIPPNSHRLRVDAERCGWRKVAKGDLREHQSYSETRQDPAQQFKDLNDWTRAGATCG